jgi:acetyl esterase/lipase
MIRKTVFLLVVAIFFVVALPVWAVPPQTIAYARNGGELTSLDVYTPAQAQSSPVVFFIHGGGWHTGSKNHVGYKADGFTRAGYLFVTANYRLSPAVMHPAHVEDLAKAIAWVYKNIGRYGGDPKKIIVIGHSAGAHLALLLGTDRDYVERQGVPFSAIRGVVSLDTASIDLLARAKSQDNRAADVIRAAFGDDPQILRQASPINHLKAGLDYPPFLLVYPSSRQDSSQMAARFDQRLSQIGGSATRFPADGYNHQTLNKNLGMSNDPVTLKILQFFSQSSN